MKDLGNFNAPQEFNGWRLPAMGVGGIVCLILLVVAVIAPQMREQVLRAWLLGFMFWGGISIGSLGIVILQYLTGGAWGVVIRRTAEAATRVLPLLAILFIPLLVGVMNHSIYEWTHLPEDPIVKWRGWYLTSWGWGLRSVIYFAILFVITSLLNNWSAKQDQTTNYEDSAEYLGAATKFSGLAMIVMILLISFAAIDWTMSLDPHWYSTMWGFLYVAGWGLSAFSFGTAVLAYLSDKAPMNRVLGKRHFHDLGKLMLALVMIWAYFNFSQFLIIWSGNIPEETVWYLTRMKGGWGVIGVTLIVLHFAFPFLVLLQQDFKRKAKWLAIMAGFILVMRLVDLFYQIQPSPFIDGHTEGFEPLSVLFYVAAVVGIGGIWLWGFFGELVKRPLVPINDPFLENAIKHGKGH